MIFHLAFVLGQQKTLLVAALRIPDCAVFALGPIQYHYSHRGFPIIMGEIAFFFVFQLSASVAASFFFARQIAFCTASFFMWSIPAISSVV